MLTKLQKRCVDISYKLGLTHLNGVLPAVDLIDSLYSVKKENEPFVLSNGHTALALYVVLEKYYKFDAEELYKLHGTHPNRDLEHKIYCSTGSLGMGLTTAVGMAIADRDTRVHVMISDGEMAEGCAWEALKIAGEQRLENLRIICLANGLSAYSKVEVDLLDSRLQMFYPVYVRKVNLYDQPAWLQGYAGHYVKMDEEKYKEICGL